MRRVAFATVMAFTLAGLVAAGAARADLSPEEAQEHWARRLTGRHYTATVHSKMEGWGERRMTLRWDDSARRERLLVRIDFPEEMRGDSWLMIENADRSNDYFVYSTRRASARAKRVPSISSDSFLGVAAHDYLGFRVASYGRPVAKSVTPATIGERKALRLSEEATDMIFERREVWLDAKSFVPLRAEYWRAGVKFMVAETERFESVQGVETPVRIRFTYSAWGDVPERTGIWEVESIDYEHPILESFFSVPR